jgi:DNA-binding response OmpR family regulator
VDGRLARAPGRLLRDLSKGRTSRPLHPTKILFVERDPHVRALAAQFLIEAGHQVELALDGQEAFGKVRTYKPDLVLCEILLPKLDGLALCRQVKTNPETRHVLVLILSILAASARANDAGADGFLLKPLAQHRLIAMVRDLIEKRSPTALPQLQERSC